MLLLGICSETSAFFLFPQCNQKQNYTLQSLWNLPTSLVYLYMCMRTCAHMLSNSLSHTQTALNKKSKVVYDNSKLAKKKNKLKISVIKINHPKYNLKTSGNKLPFEI